MFIPVYITKSKILCRKNTKIHIKIIMILIYLITFVAMIACNIQLQNKKDSFIKNHIPYLLVFFQGIKQPLTTKGIYMLRLEC